MQLGTHVRLPDGREGTVVYNSLIGVGIKWGLHDPDPKDFEGTSGNTVPEVESTPGEWPWQPDALLREPWPSCSEHGFAPSACVGTEYEIIRVGLHGGD